MLRKKLAGLKVVSTKWGLLRILRGMLCYYTYEFCPETNLGPTCRISVEGCVHKDVLVTVDVFS